MILLLSGGIDSFVAYHYLNKPKTVYFNLGTPYTEKEIKVVKQMDPSIIIDNSLVELGKTQIGDKAYIPYRNLYLAMRASQYDNDVVIAGIKGDDVSDKNESIFKLFSNMLSHLERRAITVTSPFWEMTKEQIVAWYLENKPSTIDLFSGTVSCYSEKEETYCGECPCCFRKWAALVNNGFDIPFHNPHLMDDYKQSAEEGRYVPERNEAILSALKIVGFQ